jgi:hypothetical protein
VSTDPSLPKIEGCSIGGSGQESQKEPLRLDIVDDNIRPTEESVRAKSAETFTIIKGQIWPLSAVDVSISAFNISKQPLLWPYDYCRCS